jgi:NADH:ubiquinone oxidoreductase subunit 4 (subunit M)
LILIGCFSLSSSTSLLAGTGIILSAGYSLWLLNRILFGNFKNSFITNFNDLTRYEFMILLPYGYLNLYIGFFPETIINYIVIN